MQTCDEFVLHLKPYAQYELTDDLSDQLERHCEVCTVCNTALNRIFDEPLIESCAALAAELAGIEL